MDQLHPWELPQVWNPFMVGCWLIHFCPFFRHGNLPSTFTFTGPIQYLFFVSDIQPSIHFHFYWTPLFSAVDPDQKLAREVPWGKKGIALEPTAWLRHCLAAPGWSGGLESENHRPTPLGLSNIKLVGFLDGSRVTFQSHSFQRSFFSGNHQKPETMDEKNGESTPRMVPP